MRNILPVVISAALLASAAQAEQRPGDKPFKLEPAGKVLPLKGGAAGNSCAAYGAGFVRLEGSNTCVKIGGAVRIDTGASR